MSDNKRQVAKLRVAGLTDAEISREVGISPGYISQLSEDTEFKKLLEQMRAAQGIVKHEQYARTDNNWDMLEEQLSEFMVANSDVVMAAMMNKPGTIINYGKMLNGMKRRSTGEAQTDTTAATISLELPEFMIEQAVVQVQHNAANEIIEVDNTPLVTMDSDNLIEEANQHMNAKIEKLAATVPEPVAPIEQLQLG